MHTKNKGDREKREKTLFLHVTRKKKKKMENAAWLSQLTVNLTKLKNYCQLSRWPLTSETDDEFSFLGLGTLPYIGNFVHIGGFLFGLFASLALLPRTNYRCRSLAVNSCVKAIFVTLLLILLVCMCVAFFLVRNPKKFCSWCHYVDCVPYKKDHFCPSMDSDGFLDNGTWRQVTIMFRVVANSTPVGIRLRAVSLTPWFNERNARAANPRDARRKARLASSISCVVIFVSRAFRSTD